MKYLKNLRVNFNILIPLIILSVFSLITLYNIGPLLPDYYNPMLFFIKQLIGFIAGFTIIILLYNLNFKKFDGLIDLAYFILVIMLFILIFKLPFIDKYLVEEVNGARGWFIIPFIGIQFQPMEFFKIFVVLKLAKISQEHLDGYYTDGWIIKKYLIYGFFPTFLILLEPDLGGFILISFTIIVMLLFSIKNKKIFKYLMFAILVILIFIMLIVFIPDFSQFLIKYTPLKPYQFERIKSWLDPFSTEGGYQLSQSLTFMGSAGPYGYGPGFDQISYPEPQTDLIFTTFVGFFGWILGAVLIFLYGFIDYNIFIVSEFQKNYYFKFITIGFGALFFIQVVENIGMLVGVLPITGIVLPFMSYGVSALLTYSVIFGIILNISSQTDFHPEKYNKL